VLEEWQDSHRYFMRLCPSNTEEMVKIGMLCYNSSIFIFRDDLKQAIISHPSWTPSDPTNPPISDIYVGELNNSSKKTKLLFVSSEKSKQEEVSNLLRSIYDGTQKSYPNGSMMGFVPITDLYGSSSDFRTKLQFNHEKYIGDETLFFIGGFQNLNNLVTLKNGNSISIRMLLKSILASEGISRPQLFQQAEPNHGAMVTIVTFQASEKDIVIARQDTLEEELRNVIAPGQENKLFLNEFDGIWIGGVNKNKKGVHYTSLKNKTKDAADYSAHINNIMNSPPKKGY
jgi:hypothetical protein